MDKSIVGFEINVLKESADRCSNAVRCPITTEKPDCIYTSCCEKYKTYNELKAVKDN